RPRQREFWRLRRGLFHIYTEPSMLCPRKRSGRSVQPAARGVPMAKPPLSMKPTGWFQVAWSDEIAVGDVHKMVYFGKEMVAWRAQSGLLTVMDAYCEHLGAHLGFGGHVEGEVIECAFHGWQWNHEGRNVCIPYENR